MGLPPLRWLVILSPIDHRIDSWLGQILELDQTADSGMETGANVGCIEDCLPPSAGTSRAGGLSLLFIYFDSRVTWKCEVLVEGEELEKLIE